MPRFRTTDNGKHNRPAGQHRKVDPERNRVTEALTRNEALAAGRVPFFPDAYRYWRIAALTGYSMWAYRQFGFSLNAPYQAGDNIALTSLGASASFSHQSSNTPNGALGGSGWWSANLGFVANTFFTVDFGSPKACRSFYARNLHVFDWLLTARIEASVNGTNWVAITGTLTMPVGNDNAAAFTIQ